MLEGELVFSVGSDKAMCPLRDLRLVRVAVAAPVAAPVAVALGGLGSACTAAAETDGPNATGLAAAAVAHRRQKVVLPGAAVYFHWSGR
ncbi:MAG: hypothetical protein ACLPTB_11800 [Acidimicrobiales bacterium]